MDKRKGQSQRVQARRKAQRRERTEERNTPDQTARRTGFDLADLIPVAVVAIAIALFFFFLLQRSTARAPAAIQNGTALALSAPIQGIHCDATEQGGYHIHAHLVLLKAGKAITIPAYVGFENSCLYWLHTHDDTGIIHVEAPRLLKPVLGNFFAVWGQPLTRANVASSTVGNGQSIRSYVGTQLYTGDPAKIPLADHRSITIEIGPPFRTPRLFDFAAAGV